MAATTSSETAGTKGRVVASISLAIVTVVELALAITLLLECIDLLSEAPTVRPSFDYLWWHDTLSTDVIILLLAMSAAVVGSFVLAASSYVKYHGNKTLVLSWVPWYLARAPIAAALAVILYLVVRAGLVPTTSASEEVSPLGVAALAGLAGMFSESCRGSTRAGLHRGVWQGCEAGRSPRAARADRCRQLDPRG